MDGGTFNDPAKVTRKNAIMLPSFATFSQIRVNCKGYFGLEELDCCNEWIACTI